MVEEPSFGGGGASAGRHVSDGLGEVVRAIEHLTEAVERAADANEGLLALQARDELRRSARGLFELASKYDTDERRPLRIVRQ